MRKLILFIVPLVLLTIFFIFLVLVLNKESGKGALQVTSQPNGSKVYINGEYIGNTPLCRCELPQMLKVGNYTVKILPSDASLGTYEDQIKINANVLTVVDRTFEGNGKSSGSLITLDPIDDKKDAQLLIISFPSNIDTFLDNNPSGNTPVLLKNLTASDHDVRLSKLGFADKILKIRTVTGYKLSAVVSLSIGAQSSSVPSASPSATPSSLQSKVIILPTPTGFLRVRKEANLSSAQIGTVKPGETYDLILEYSGWYEIKLKDGSSGWVSSDYTKKQ